ncbi:zinc dependent phospholipase C family protein [Methanobacterium sp.]|uniref:zinc dependent phospholipase C family protein n=1 Tax=unclassified Methanobacterium TaxID=2627676 RepID=UPI003158851C
MVFLLSVPLLISPAAAWHIQTHPTIADKVYYSLPASVQHKLSLSEMERGSKAPDQVFKDFKYHQYTASVSKSKYWLDRGKAAYKSKNYKYASYCFGVASHYISDTYSAPHCVTGEGDANHLAYEKQGMYMAPSIRYMSGSVDSILRNGYLQGQKDWKLWIVNKSRSVTQRDLNNAGSAAYSLIRNCF